MREKMSQSYRLRAGFVATLAVVALFMIGCHDKGLDDRKAGQTEGQAGLLRQSDENEVASPYILTGVVVKLTDGDSITILDDDKNKIRVRLKHIDAPEKRQDFGTKSKEHLSKLIDMGVGNKSVFVIDEGKDHFGRTLGIVYANDPSVSDVSCLNIMMVEAGLAWHYKEYSTDEGYAAAEISAREKQIGLWSHSDSMPPWKWRANQRELSKQKKRDKK